MTDSDTRDEWIGRHRTLGEFERVGYEGLGEAYNKRLYALRSGHFLRLLRRLPFDPKCRILDIGSGTGFYVDLYRDLGATRLCGLDLSPDAVSRLSRRHPEFRFLTHDITEPLPTAMIERGPFDFVSAMDVLFHITDDARWRRAVENCADAVAPSGTLLISDNFPSRALPPTSSQSFHTLAQYEAILSPLGFRRVELTPVFFLSNGQVASGGCMPKLLSLHWRIVVATLGRSLRANRPLGEFLGGIAGVALTTLDAILQRQSLFQGFSTKIAVFRREASPSQLSPQ